MPVSGIAKGTYQGVLRKSVVSVQGCERTESAKNCRPLRVVFSVVQVAKTMTTFYQMFHQSSITGAILVVIVMRQLRRQEDMVENEVKCPVRHLDEEARFLRAVNL